MMTPDAHSRRTIVFVNIAHAFDHFVPLIYPTAVLAMAPDLGLSYGSLIGLSTGTYVAFGLFSLPVGWIADRIGRRNFLAIYFGGCGLTLFALAASSTPPLFALWLTVLGMFLAIYHPIGSTLLVAHTSRLGHDLSWNGVWGNLGASLASGITAVIAAYAGWRTAIAVPGIVCILAGVAFLALVTSDGEAHATDKAAKPIIPVTRPMTLLIIFAIAIIAGGMTFNITTITLPKVLDEQLGLPLPLSLTGSLATAVFTVGALTQLLIGRLVERTTLPKIFVGLAVLQPLGLGLTALSTGVPLLIGLVLTMAAIYGQVVINDAMVARYVPSHLRAKAFSVRYFLGFTAAGMAVPTIALLHDNGGFPIVLGAAAAFGFVVFFSAIAFLRVTSDKAKPAA